MLCTSCKYPHSDVVKTRHDESRNLTIRRRECLRCGLRFTTHEQHKETKRPNDDRFQLGNVK
jgi:transcriptional regulator NrdR family protein